jgi:hypothetical protein
MTVSLRHAASYRSEIDTPFGVYGGISDRPARLTALSDAVWGDLQ